MDWCCPGTNCNWGRITTHNSLMWLENNHSKLLIALRSRLRSAGLSTRTYAGMLVGKLRKPVCSNTSRSASTMSFQSARSRWLLLICASRSEVQGYNTRTYGLELGHFFKPGSSLDKCFCYRRRLDRQLSHRTTRIRAIAFIHQQLGVGCVVQTSGSLSWSSTKALGDITVQTS